MKVFGNTVALSATDLANHLACPHLTSLNLRVAKGEIAAPAYSSTITAALRERGLAHENAYIAHLTATGLGVADLRDQSIDDIGAAATKAAMDSGVEVIVQAPLAHAGWGGRADVLIRNERSSNLGAWSYEPADTKLAAETKAGTVLQLCTYAELLEALQGIPPEHFNIVAPGSPFAVSTYRFADFQAYYRSVRERLVERTTEAADPATYPDPVAYCDICRWWQECDARRRTDDHLSFIAGIGRVHREELVTQGFPTLSGAATMPLPIGFKPGRGSRATYARIREQARVQFAQRTTGQPVHELLLPVVDGQGLARLPAPSPGDLFLDLEGARYAREGGREYLFGIWGRTAEDGWRSVGYEGAWALTDEAERTAFERAIDRAVTTVESHPGSHIYHFGHYEPSAFKRLMGRYATRQDEIDGLLRSERFIDLHMVVRHALRAGVESYSIKQLEQFYSFTREVPLHDASANLHAMELALESNALAAISPDLQGAVQTYNADDCRSTEALRNWLEGLRTELQAHGTPVPRPTLRSSDASQKVGELEGRQQQARATLLGRIAPEAQNAEHPDHPRWLLAYLIDWHRREAKSAWWEYYRLRDLPALELFEEAQAIAGLEPVERVDVVLSKKGKPTGSVIDRYRYPVQEVEIGGQAKLSMPGGDTIGTLTAHDRLARTIDIKKGPKQAEVHPEAVFEGDVISTTSQQEALLRFCAKPDERNCGTDLLFRHSPRLASREFRQPRTDESIVDFAMRLATDLDHTTLAVQGPPGAGKTYVGAQMIRALVHAGKRVGVTAVSHKVIRNLLDAVMEQERGGNAGSKLRAGHKRDESRAHDTDAGISTFADNKEALEGLATGVIQVLGATSWLWSREDATASVDVLFVDEAGQMSLANTLAVSAAAGSVVLLGDPQQLLQPQKGSHPDGVDVSALDHVLGGASTMPTDRGLFLPTTWRLHPSIAAFTSEVFYEGKLQAKPGLENQRLDGTIGFDGAGLWWVAVAHDGNQNASMEEVEVVAGIVDRILTPNAEWQDEHGVRKALGPDGIRIVAPYNAQVNRLAERLVGRGVPVGTVDKFQGQEAPVVIYSMATSCPEDAPRGMEFLYSLNRLNVATSRARCVAIIVASPRLLEPSCRTPRQMILANALCRFHELSGTSDAL